MGRELETGDWRLRDWEIDPSQFCVFLLLRPVVGRHRSILLPRRHSSLDLGTRQTAGRASGGRRGPPLHLAVEMVYAA